MTNRKRGVRRTTTARRRRVGFSLGVCLLALTLPAWSAPRNGGAAYALKVLAQSQSAIGPDQAAAVARKVTGGRVLAVSSGKRKGVVVYRVRVLMPDGRVRVVLIDAQSGRVIG